MLRGLLPILAGLGLVHHAVAQKRCADAPNYFEPLTSGDGQRYPLSIGPAWRLLGSGVYPVKGSDGLIHLAFAMQFTNAWSIAMTMQSRSEERRVGKEGRIGERV